MTPIEIFTRDAAATFAAEPLGDAISGTSPRPGLSLGCWDDGKPVDCGSDTPSWRMSDRVAEGLAVFTAETPLPHLPFLVWEQSAEVRDTPGLVIAVEVSYRLLAPAPAWIPPSAISESDASGAVWVDAADVPDRYSSDNRFASGAYRIYSAREWDEKLMARLSPNMRAPIAYSAGILQGAGARADSQLPQVSEVRRTLDFWN